MVALGFLEKHDEDRYQNSAIAQNFLSGSHPLNDMRPMLRFWNHISYNLWTKLEDGIRSGKSQLDLRNFDDKQQEIFSRGVQAVSSGPANSLASNYDFTRHRRVLDLGGGTGSFLTALLSRYGEHLEEGALFELPRTTAVAREAISKGPFSGKIKIIEGDFFKDQIPCGHDVVILANVVHLFTPEHNLELLRRIRGRVADGARLLLVDFWTDPSHTDPLPAPFLAGEFLLVTGEGDVYSEEEVSAWLASTGWTKVERKPLEGAASLIVAESKAA